MRTIKYQAWHKAQQKMYHVENMLFGENGVRLLYLTSLDGSRGLTTDKLDDVELRVFTGLLDKHSKEIYEGDYLRLTLGNHVLEVRWGVFSFQFWDSVTDSQKLVYAADLKRLEVIGSIYEQPVLEEVKS